MKFPESALAHRLLDGKLGIEIGGSAHNSFNIFGCLNVNYTNESTAHTKAEIELCGESLPVDIVAEGDKLPFPNDSQEFVLNSHVLEHLPNMFGALTEWHRITREGGLIYTVFPRKDDNPEDQKYEYTTYEHLVKDWDNNETVETHPCLPGQDPRGHYHFLTLEQFIDYLGMFFDNAFEVIEIQEKDEKVGNGWTCVLKVHKNTAIQSCYRKVD